MELWHGRNTVLINPGTTYPQTITWDNKSLLFKPLLGVQFLAGKDILVNTDTLSFLASLLYPIYSSGPLLNSTTPCLTVFWRVSPLASLLFHSLSLCAFSLPLGGFQLCIFIYSSHKYLLKVYYEPDPVPFSYTLEIRWWIRPLRDKRKGEDRGEERTEDLFVSLFMRFMVQHSVYS